MNPSLIKRIVFVLGAVLIQSIYIPTSLLMTGGIEPKFPIDINIPLWTVWVIPYTLCYPLWFSAIAWMILKTDERRFISATAGLYFTFIIGITIFIVFPTYITLPELTGTDVLTRLLYYLQVGGGSYDALPSAHIYITTILALIYRDWYPRYKWLWLFIVIIISLSTLFTKQHYIADVFCGYLVGWIGYRLGLLWAERKEAIKFEEATHA